MYEMADMTMYPQYENAMAQLDQRKKIEQKVARGFYVADVHLNRSYLDRFSSADILPPERSVPDLTKLRMVQITKLVLDTRERFTDKLMSVYTALYGINSTAAVVIDSDGQEVRFYIGVRSEENAAAAGGFLEGTLKGNFPGIEFESLQKNQVSSLIRSIENEHSKSLSSVSVVPAARKQEFETEEFVQGIEKLIDTLAGKSYTLISLAVPLDAQSMQKRKHGYEELCSAMSPYKQISVTYGENESLSVNDSLSSSLTTSVNRSVSNSNSTSSSRSSGTNFARSSGSSRGGGFSDSGWSMNWGSNDGYSNGSFDSYTSGTSFTQAVSDSSGSSSSEGRTRGETTSSGSSKSVSLNYENQGVSNLIERAQAQLDRFAAGEAFGMWEFCSYVLSDNNQTAALASNAYRALVTGAGSRVESSHINFWSGNRAETIGRISQYILHFVHPKAEIPALEGGYDSQQVSPTNLVTGEELPLVMGLPKKSVAGLAVIEMAEFGRSVVYENGPPRKTIDFGNIYHMGVTEERRVSMDLDLLASHCFITGSSGSGKSYATYQLLASVLQNDVKIMIIEPAKGEYKQIFGGVHGIKIYTTDPNSYRLLRINPFRFPEEIPLLAHVEQLLQIFNAAWPLYAAMPAILKQAVVDAYVKCGWDVQNSIWIEGVCDHKYPVFSDVLEILPNIINTSDYSAESKGDYKGALLTRVQSMTVGLNGVIFKSSEGIPDSLLFDSNTIVDLSDLGSDEAIALIMGVLIMKLNEHRRSQRKSGREPTLNSCLRHVTVLEEAHNILKRTSKEQNQEGSNMVGKSVEMISNSIKELRTYGEGFVIVDQSPMAVDTSAIENTATKIIMNTPARDACEELGSALSLNDVQTAELARLNVGIAAVFQKGWLSPVLMKVDAWDYRYDAAVQRTDPAELRVLKGKLVSCLLGQYRARRFSANELRRIIRESDLPDDKKQEIKDVISSYNARFDEAKGFMDRMIFAELLTELVGCEALFNVISMDMIPKWSEVSREKEQKDKDSVLKQGRSAARQWLKQFSAALNCYLYQPDEKQKTELILHLLYKAGAEGDVKRYPESRTAVLCMMLNNIYGTKNDR